MKEAELSHEDIVRQLKLEHAKETTKLRQEFETSAKELQQKYEKKVGGRFVENLSHSFFLGLLAFNLYE